MRDHIGACSGRYLGGALGRRKLQGLLRRHVGSHDRLDWAGASGLGNLLTQGTHVQLLADKNTIGIVNAVGFGKLLGQPVGLGAFELDTHGGGLFLHDVAEGVARDNGAAERRAGCRGCALGTLQNLGKGGTRRPCRVKNRIGHGARKPRGPPQRVQAASGFGLKNGSLHGGYWAGGIIRMDNVKRLHWHFSCIPSE